VPPEAVIFGEIGLAGEVRGVGQSELRLKEAAKLGFTRAIVPAGRQGPKPPQRARRDGHRNRSFEQTGPAVRQHQKRPSVTCGKPEGMISADPESQRFQMSTMNTVDIVVIAVVAISALIAFLRGFVREVLTIGSWLGASLVTLYGFPLLQPKFEQWISSKLAADIVCGISAVPGQPDHLLDIEPHGRPFRSRIGADRGRPFARIAFRPGEGCDSRVAGLYADLRTRSEHSARRTHHTDDGARRRDIARHGAQGTCQ
jgi:hypothetical protein